MAKKTVFIYPHRVSKVTQVRNLVKAKIPETIIENGEIPDMQLKNNLPQKRKNRVFIVGGGTSLDNFDFSLLDDEDTIVINQSLEFVKNPFIFLTMDYSFYQKEKELVLSKKANHSIFILNLGNSQIKLVNNFYYDIKNRISYQDLDLFDYVIKSNGINDSITGFGDHFDNFKNGHNSGFCAIQLALLMDYQEIYLLGIDMKIDGKTHFHNKYSKTNIERNIESYKNILISSLEKSQRSHKIISLSEKSLLNKTLQYQKISDVKRISKKEILVVGYFTLGTPYVQEAEKTKASCDKFNLQHYIVGVENLGSWQKNTRYKALFLKECLLKFPDKKIVYVDCDAKFLQYPTFFDNLNCDISVCFQDFPWKKNECLSGTIYLESNANTIEICDKWYNLNVKEGDEAKTFEQWNLGTLIEEMKSRINFRQLPPEYCFIFDSMRRIYGEKMNPVIEHYQKSREFKKLI